MIAKTPALVVNAGAIFSCGLCAYASEDLRKSVHYLLACVASTAPVEDLADAFKDVF